MEGTRKMSGSDDEMTMKMTRSNDEDEWK